MRALRALLAALIASASAHADALDSIWVVPGSHLDVGFTDTPSAVREKRVRVLDDAIDAALADPDFRWNEEGGWVFDAWLATHRADADRLQTMRKLLQEGRVYVGATYVNPHAAIFPESLDLLTIHLDRLEKDFGVRPRTAIVNDVPSVPEALVDALAERGVRYLLCGANLAFTPPLPKELCRSPFWWESASGRRLLVSIDPDSYTAAYMKWGIDPDCARFFNAEEFPRDRGPIETMEAGIERMRREIDGELDAVVVQHAFDNWDAGGARKLPAFVRQWNAAKKSPRIALATAEAWFEHVERNLGDRLPVRRGEWGGDWDSGRAACPVWTWRVRKACAAVDANTSYEARAALAVVMDHSFTLGGGWPEMFTDAQTRDHAREGASFFEEAVRGTLGREGVGAMPAERVPPASRELSDSWRELLSDAGRPARLRAGRCCLGPFLLAEAPTLDTAIEWGVEGSRLVLATTIDRTKLPDEEGGAVVVEIPLRSSPRDVRLAPASSPTAMKGTWLRGAPPSFVVAPGELAVLGLRRGLRVRSPLVFSWAVVADPSDPGRAWLQGLVLRQSTRCVLKGGERRSFSFEELYPGEPALLSIEVELEILE